MSLQSTNQEQLERFAHYSFTDAVNGLTGCVRALYHEKHGIHMDNIQVYETELWAQEILRNLAEERVDGLE